MKSSRSKSSKNVSWIILPGLGWIYLAFLVVRAAWLGDDALITFRAIENFTAGYGPVYNVGQRVQVFTHPLWMMVISIPYAGLKLLNLAEPGSLYYLTMALSIFFSLTAAGMILARLAGGWQIGLAGVLFLAASGAFVDYSTSGLENPLVYWLSVLFMVVYSQGAASENSRFRWLGIVSLLAALIGCTRLDLLLLVIPVVIAAWWRLPAWQPKTGLVWSAAGMFPLIAWEIFSLFYYGFPFPNTAYAKLGADVSQQVLWRQGGIYFLDSLQNDPVTLPVILLACGVGIWGKGLDRRLSLPFVVGISGYLLYVLRIGGDFMSGRFFAVPFVLAVGILLQVQVKRKWLLTIILAAAMICGLIFPFLRIVSGADYQAQDSSIDRIGKTGIANERAFYYRYSGLLIVLANNRPPTSPFAGNSWRAGSQPRRVELVDVAGKPGFDAGPDVHVLDRWAITDPLLARLPSIHRTYFRIGHLERDIPLGYLESLQSGKNQLAQPSLAAYYDRLSLIIHGELWLPGRLLEIVKINAGVYQPLLAEYAATIRRLH